MLHLLCCEGSKPPGSDRTRTHAQTTCVPTTDVQTMYVSAEVNTLQDDGLARIPEYDKDYICRTLSHQTASPRALFVVLVLDRGRGKIMNDLVGRDCELPFNKAKLHTRTYTLSL